MSWNNKGETEMPNLMKIRPVTARMCLAATDRQTDRQTHMEELTVAVRSFAHAPKNRYQRRWD